jgi:hypothetical protein
MKQTVISADVSTKITAGRSLLPLKSVKGKGDQYNVTFGYRTLLLGRLPYKALFLVKEIKG